MTFQVSVLINLLLLTFVIFSHARLVYVSFGLNGYRGVRALHLAESVSEFELDNAFLA